MINENLSKALDNIVNSEHLEIIHQEEIQLSALVVNRYDEQFLQNIYSQVPNLKESSYDEQINFLTQQFYSDGDFYTYNLSENGWVSSNIVWNNEYSQIQWCKENNIEYQSNAETLIEQIKIYSPTVLFLNSPNLAIEEFISPIRDYVGIIAGKLDNDLPENFNPKLYDTIFSSIPKYVTQFRELGVTAYYQQQSFDKRVLDAITPLPARDLDVVFMGDIASNTPFLEELTSKVDIPIYGKSEEVPKSLTHFYKGEIFGLDKFEIMLRSKIVIYKHNALSDTYATSKRLFEITGCGALLITDHKENISDIFEVGKEVVTYSDGNELIEKVTQYLKDKETASKIASNGQKKTINYYSYSKRMFQTSTILQRQLKLFNQQEYQITHPISQDYRVLDKTDITPNLINGWKSKEIPLRERAIINKDLKSMYKGDAIPVFDVLSLALENILKDNSSVLEIGCASGYYSEVIEYLNGVDYNYTGIDYSEDYINMAKEYYPNRDFYISNGNNLIFDDNSFDIVLHSSVVNCTDDYKKQIEETVRVSNNWIVIHRIIFCKNRPTFYLSKKSYGIETLEARLNETELLSLFEENDCELVNRIDYVQDRENDIYEGTWIFRKKENKKRKKASTNSLQSTLDTILNKNKTEESSIPSKIETLESLKRDQNSRSTTKGKGRYKLSINPLVGKESNQSKDASSLHNQLDEILKKSVVTADNTNSTNKTHEESTTNHLQNRLNSILTDFEKKENSHEEKAPSPKSANSLKNKLDEILGNSFNRE